MRSQIETSLEYKAAIVDHSTDAIIAKNLDSIVTVWNDGAERLFGYSKAEMVGQPILRLLPKDRQDEEGLILDCIRQGGRASDLHTVRLKKNGELVEVSITVSPLIDEEGQLIGAVKTARDVSELVRSEERFRLVVEAAPNAIVAVDEVGRIALVNRQTEILFGYTRHELIGKPVDVLIPARWRANHESVRSAFQASPQARSMGAGRDLFGLRKDGTEVPVEIGLNPVNTPTGVLILASIIDITERKRAEALLVSQRSDLERSNKDLEQFAYVASHDLQEPLRAIAGFVEILHKRYETQLDDRAKEYIRHAVEGCTRMRTLIEDLLSFSRIGRSETQRPEAGGEEAATAAMRNLSAAIQESGAQITWDPLPLVLVAPAHLTMLIQNLVGNAIKFREPTKSPRIHISAQMKDHRAIFSVQDNGIGIANEHFERIFRVFQRLHTRDEYPGTGIGLAICKRIVEQNGGRIWLQSERDTGTLFQFDLPLCQDEKNVAK